MLALGRMNLRLIEMGADGCRILLLGVGFTGIHKMKVVFRGGCNG